jgi:carbon-monoxide dehydrogenase large subunit
VLRNGSLPLPASRGEGNRSSRNLRYRTRRGVGAAAQGIGQALLELCYFDRNSAQNMAASFMDYAIPRADVLPTFDCELIELPATSHRYGIRPGGEGGTTPALAATINAVVDALSEFGVRHVEMPATPERVWRAIQEAKARR